MLWLTLSQFCHYFVITTRYIYCISRHDVFSLLFLFLIWYLGCLVISSLYVYLFSCHSSFSTPSFDSHLYHLYNNVLLIFSFNSPVYSSATQFDVWTRFLGMWWNSSELYSCVPPQTSAQLGTKCLVGEGSRVTIICNYNYFSLLQFFATTRRLAF